MKTNFNESDLESAIVELFRQEGYQYSHGDEIHRQLKDVLLYDDLRAFLSSEYPQLSSTEIEKVVSRIDNLPSVPLYESNREAYRLVTEGFDLVRDNSQLAVHIDYIDFDNVDNNVFRVVNQYAVEDGHLRIPDMLVFVNGIPVGIFEFKTAVKEDKTIHDAWEQITIRYARDIPSLLRFSFLSVISDGANTRLGTIFSPYKFYYSWNKADEQETVANGISSLLTMVKGAFAKERILKILRDFVFYPDDSKSQEAVICRYPQFFAANKMFESLKAHRSLWAMARVVFILVQRGVGKPTQCCSCQDF